jgi:predicted small secreted protein
MRLAYIAVVSVALLLTACSTTVGGSAVKESGAARGPTVDISKLDVGPYPTQPAQPLGVTGDPSRGVLVEAQRMANNVVGPWEVDAGLTKWFGFGATVLQNAADLANIGPEPFAAAAGRHGFINGFVSARTAEGQKILLNAVLRFDDPGAAAAAATDFGDIAGKTGEGVQRAQIPGHPDAQAASYTQTEGSSGKRWSAVRAFSAHGQYVFMQLAQAVDAMDAATGLVAKTIDLQGPAIDQFRATDPSEFADISLDPTGLLARTLPVPDKEATIIQNTTYEQRGALHFQSDPSRSATLFSDTGTDLVAMAKTNVYQTEDSEGAGRIVDGFFAELQPTSQPAKPVNNLPDSRCLQLEDQSFYCLGAADRYAIETTAESLLDAQQQVAAQYAMLLSG